MSKMGFLTEKNLGRIRRLTIPCVRELIIMKLLIITKGGIIHRI